MGRMAVFSGLNNKQAFETVGMCMQRDIIAESSKGHSRSCSCLAGPGYSQRAGVPREGGTKSLRGVRQINDCMASSKTKLENKTQTGHFTQITNYLFLTYILLVC